MMGVKHLDRVGVELEGGWAHRPEPGSGEVHGDCSVDASGPGIGYSGEVVSAPYKNPTRLFAWVRAHYPEKVDFSCGLHVHISAIPHAYSQLISRDYARAFEAWAATFNATLTGPDADRFRRRLRGDKDLLKRLPVNAEEAERLFVRQFRARGKEQQRYYQLNFCHTLRGTLENRLFPAFETADTACRAIEAYLRFTEAFLTERKADKPEELPAIIEEAEEPTTAPAPSSPIILI